MIEIQQKGEEHYKAKIPLLIASEKAMCSRGFSNQIDCFARIVLLAQTANAILVLERIRFFPAPYQHRDGRQLEPLIRPSTIFENGEAPQPTMPFESWWDVDFFIEVSGSDRFSLLVDGAWRHAALRVFVAFSSDCMLFSRAEWRKPLQLAMSPASLGRWRGTGDLLQHWNGSAEAHP
jgi:hypothetical protein